MEACLGKYCGRSISRQSMQEGFRDPLRVDYATTRLWHFELITQHMLEVEHARFDTQTTYQNRIEFCALEWYEARKVTWKSEPLFIFELPASTT